MKKLYRIDEETAKEWGKSLFKVTFYVEEQDEAIADSLVSQIFDAYKKIDKSIDPEGFCTIGMNGENCQQFIQKEIKDNE